MSIFRVCKQENPYVLLDKRFLEDPTISLRLKGFLAYCLSKPNDWQFHVRQMASVLKEGKTSLYSIIDEGIESGYIKRSEQQKDEAGRFGSTEYLIFEIKQKADENKKFTDSTPPVSEKQDTEISTVSANQHTGRRTLLNNNITKKRAIKKKKILKEKEEPARKARQPAAASIKLNAERRQFEGITAEDLKAWKELYPAVHVEQEIKKCAEWAMTTPRQNYRKSILTWLSNVQKTHTTPYEPPKEKVSASEEEIKQNLEDAKKIESYLQKRPIHNYDVRLLSDAIEFIFPNPNDNYKVNIKTERKQFVNLCRPALKRLGLVK